MDDPRSLLESNQIFSIKRRGALNENMYHTMSWHFGWSTYVDILHVVLDRGQKTINS